MHQRRATLDVAEELIAEAVAFVGAFDEPGDVGDDERFGVVGADDAEVRDERRERIVGDLRLRGADDGDERGLAGVGQSDQTHVRDQFQLDEELALLAGVAVLREARGLARGGGEVLIAPPSPAAFGHEHALAVVGEVGDHLVRDLVADDRADRQLDGDVTAVRARAVRAHAVLSAAGLPLALELEVIEGVQAFRGDDPDGAARAAVAAGRTALGDELLTAKGDAAMPTVAGFYADRCLVDEHFKPLQQC